MQSQRSTDADHATCGLIAARGSQGFQPWECERDAGGAKEVAALDIHGGGRMGL